MLSKYAWRAVRSKVCWYAVTTVEIGGRRKTIKMNRLIANTQSGLQCHHKNGNSLDNRRINLENLYRLEHDMLHIMYRHAKMNHGLDKTG